VPLIDPRTGLIDRAWYLFFLSLQDIATSVVDDVVGPSADALLASYDAALQALAQEVETQPPPVDLSAELIKQIEAAGLIDCCSGLVSQVAEMQKQLEALSLLPPPTQGTVTAVTATAPVVSSGGIAPDISLAAGYGDTQNPYAAKTANYVLASPNGSSGVPTFRALVAADIPALPYGTGTVTSVSVVSANGFAGTVATATTTPAITLTTSISGVLYGNGTAIAAATISAPLAYSAGTLSITQSSASTDGYLSSTDWNTFNNKQPAGTYVTSVTGTAPVVSSGGTTPAISMAAANTSTNGYLTSTDWNTFNNKQPAGTYVTAVSVVSANGLAGTSSGGATPALTLSTTITGLLKGNGTAISAATSGTDYAPATSGTSILYGNGAGGFSNVTVGSGLSFSAGTLAATTSAPSAPVTQTANFTVAATDVWLINNKSGSTCTVTLPTASANSGRVLYFQNYQVQALVSASSNVVPLAGGAAATSILLASSGDSATLVSDGTNWLMTQYIPNNILLLE
jgi:hypothetical protein